MRNAPEGHARIGGILPDSLAGVAAPSGICVALETSGVTWHETAGAVS